MRGGPFFFSRQCILFFVLLLFFHTVDCDILRSPQMALRVDEDQEGATSDSHDPYLGCLRRLDHEQGVRG